MLSTDQIQKIVSTVERETSNDACYVQPIHDPKQTHALYSINKNSYASVKVVLKRLGAKYFRKVTANSKSFIIVCFNADDIKM